MLTGAIVSLITLGVKKYFGTSSLVSLATVVVVSIVAGAGSWYLHHANLWDSFLQIVSSASAVYSLFIKNAQDISAGNFTV